MSETKVVVGVDASPAGADALRWAARHATNGEVVAVSVCRMHPAGGSGEDAFRSAHRRALREAVEGLPPTPGVRVAQLLVDGDPGPALVALSHGADKLVLGGHRYQRGNVAVAGAVATYCLRHAKCPVVIVPAGGDDESPGVHPRPVAQEFR
ncbi:universal stress protein [Saccharothrix coeruleofusca]|uniref:Universal stress protein n=1 Tax=Saccharothrix coeruleofusca TaxID=33919 RepID=A0A918AUA0_9PSEU|nr:universal stress protein [Saccharothrix coeruleofusca]MBP2335697.1 nucleotide-binding universal stress UspA family protein [Saccharothrix coeruleofusca]GGP75706.1 universal stress protein [Saccharothrix coeruleofusca]